MPTVLKRSTPTQLAGRVGPYGDIEVKNRAELPPNLVSIRSAAYSACLSCRDATQYVLDLAATLPGAISDTDAVYLYGLDILAQPQGERLPYVHDGWAICGIVDTSVDLVG